MSITKNRKFRFTSGDFVSNDIFQSEENTSSSIEKSLFDMKINRPKNEDGTIKLSEAEQKKLQLMAKQAKENGGNSNGLSADYLSKIPARQHNQITMACAGDKIKELNKTMNEEITKTSEDEATTDILTETANDNIVYKNYAMDDLDRYMENIDSMSMLESISLKNSVAKEINRLESCHTMIKAVDDLRENFDFVEPGKEPTIMDRKNAGTNADKAVLTANYLDTYGYDENVDEFHKLYEDYKPKLDELMEKLNKRIEECSAVAASTTYMTNDFLHIIDKRINNLSEDDVNYDNLSKSLDTLRQAFGDRTNLDYLGSKLDIFVKNKKHLKNISRAFAGTFSDISSKLNKNFATKSTSSFVKTIDKIYFGNRYKTLALLYFLNYICSNEASSNEDAWVKVLILNVSDINKNIWDIDGFYSNDYLEQVYARFEYDLSIIEEYLKNHKVIISSPINAQYDYLLNWVEPVEEKSETEEVSKDNSDSQVSDTSTTPEDPKDIPFVNVPLI